MSDAGGIEDIGDYCPDKCEYCGYRGADVDTVIDPYCQELYGEENYITACEDCLQARRDDI